MNPPWPRTDNLDDSPLQAFYLKELEIKAKTTTIKEADLPLGTTLDMIPLVDVTTPLFATGRDTVFIGDQAETGTPPTYHASKFVCSIWHKGLSMTNEKVIIWIESNNIQTEGSTW